MTFRHAVIVSEHDAMLQNAMDAQPWAKGWSLCSRLPLDTVADDWDWRRFWMLLGVQVGDHAIRQRVSHVVAWYPASQPRDSQETSAPRRGGAALTARDNDRNSQDVAASDGAPKDSDSDEVEVATGRLGVIISRHVGHLEQDLLYWDRFDIVENSDAHLFAEDLEHVASEHLSREHGGTMIRCKDA